MKKLIILAAAFAATAGPALAAGNTDTQQGAATATVVAPITLTHTPGAALNFGRFTAGTGGTVVVTAAGAASATGGVFIVTGGSPAADAFSVTGDPNRTFTIATTSSTVASPGGATLAFTTAPSAATGTLSATGAANFTVGGTLTVPGTAAAAVYTGNYSATVTYN